MGDGRADVFDAGLALGGLIGELAGKTAYYPRALSVNFCPDVKELDGEPGLAARRREPARRVVSEVRSAGHCDSVPCVYQKFTASKIMRAARQKVGPAARSWLEPYSR